MSLEQILALITWIAGAGSGVLVARLYDFLTVHFAGSSLGQFLSQPSLRAWLLPIAAASVAAVAGWLLLYVQALASQPFAPVIDAMLPVAVTALFGWIGATRSMSAREVPAAVLSTSYGVSHSDAQTLQQKQQQLAATGVRLASQWTEPLPAHFEQANSRAIIDLQSQFTARNTEVKKEFDRLWQFLVADPVDPSAATTPPAGFILNTEDKGQYLKLQPEGEGEGHAPEARSS